jgi:hypothetical protein
MRLNGSLYEKTCMITKKTLAMRQKSVYRVNRPRVSILLTPGSNPTTVSYNARAVIKIYNAKS